MASTDFLGEKAIFRLMPVHNWGCVIKIICIMRQDVCGE